LKPDAPPGIRGEFKPISTALPGVQVSELLPRIAAVIDKVAVIRSIVDLRDEHSSFQNLTGYPMDQSQREQRPNLGSVISRMRGVVDPVVPPFVDLFPLMQHRPYNSAGSGFLGHAYKPTRMDGDDLELLKPAANVSLQRLGGRQQLLQQFDKYRRHLAISPEWTTWIESTSKPLMRSRLTKVAKALDLTREDPKLRNRYGIGSTNPLGDAAPMSNDQLLIARRLVEAGVRCVTVAYGFCDTHGQNFSWLRQHLPLFDQGISTLIEDI
jgi:hypothetical protein